MQANSKHRNKTIESPCLALNPDPSPLVGKIKLSTSLKLSGLSFLNCEVR